MRINSFLTLCKKAFFTLTFLLVVLRCSDEQLVPDQQLISSTQLNTTTTDATGISDCSSCTYVVPADQRIIDGTALGLKPGSVIGLNANFNYGSLTFLNIIGTNDNPIIIKNCGGTANIRATDHWFAFKTKKSKHFRVTGGSTPGTYGINIQGGVMGMTLEFLSTNFEVDHIEVSNVGFAGIMAKTDPGCDDATIRGNFLMENVDLHNNYIHHTGGEGIYAGNSFFAGMNTSCGVRLPHEIHNIRIFNNIIKYTDWDGLQLGCATKGASIYSNTVEHYGLAGQMGQNNGIQVSSGTGGLCYNNLIKKGTGNGLIVMGLGDNIIYNNIIDEAGGYGIFCDERDSPGPGFKFLNNTIINSILDGIRIYAELVPMNVIVNNIIANPGSGKFVHKLNNDVKIEMANNHFSTETESLKIIDLSQSNYLIESTSPVIDKGADISAYNIKTDFYGKARLNGITYDIGAVEAGAGTENPTTNALPVANAGPDKSTTLPVNSIKLYGSGTDSDGSIVSYKWTQDSGPTAVISDGETATATISGLVAGKYSFRLTVQDDDGGTHYDNILVEVNTSEAESSIPGENAPKDENSIPGENAPEDENSIPGENVLPVSNAGADKNITLPLNSVKLIGSATDSDGSIVSYKWTQYGGPTAFILDPESPATTISGLAAGTYSFRLTVQDDDGGIHYDDMLVRVQESSYTVRD